LFFRLVQSLEGCQSARADEVYLSLAESESGCGSDFVSAPDGVQGATLRDVSSVVATYSVSQGVAASEPLEAGSVVEARFEFPRSESERPFWRILRVMECGCASSSSESSSSQSSSESSSSVSSSSESGWFCYWRNGDEKQAYCAQPNEPDDYNDGNTPVSGPYETEEECCDACGCASSSQSESSGSDSSGGADWFCYWPGGLFANSYCAQANEPNDYHNGNKPASGPHPDEETCCRFCKCGSSDNSSSSSASYSSSSSSSRWFCYWPNGDESQAVCQRPNEADDNWNGNSPVSGPYDTEAECCKSCGCASSSSYGGSSSSGGERVIEVVTNVECKDGEIVVTKTKIWARLAEEDES
jgi:hypothetical protein